jgi:cystathionine beta-lyase
VDYACEYITKNFDGIEVSKPQGTYMLYLDCKKWCEKTGKSVEDLLKAGISVGVIWQDGRPFNYPDTIRMNLAVPFSLLCEAMERLKQYVF